MGHGPDLHRHRAHQANVLERGLVIIVLRVGDLRRLPRALVLRVVNHGRVPLAFVLWVGNHGRCPLAAAGLAGRIVDLGSLPFAVLLLVPVYRHLRLRIINQLWRILLPILGHGGFRVLDLFGGVLVPVVRLHRVRVVNASGVDPVLRLGLGGIIDLCGGVDGRLKILKQATVRTDFAIHQHLVCVVLLQNDGVQVRELVHLQRGRLEQVLLLNFAGLGTLVTKDEVNLVGVPALVRAKHDAVWCVTVEFGQLQRVRVGKQLDICAAALQALLELHLILEHKSVRRICRLLQRH
mmetsp:Transcript_50053/g.95610  ORF Transcript_50053/g.95610 Transcript_50053/m.95610 type:complete len:294 (-) Transcript_50053:353-1234(-)